MWGVRQEERARWVAVLAQCIPPQLPPTGDRQEACVTESSLLTQDRSIREVKALPRQLP